MNRVNESYHYKCGSAKWCVKREGERVDCLSLRSRDNVQVDGES